MWEQQKAMHSSLHVSSQTHKWHKHYLEKLEALHLTSYLIYIIFHFIVLLHLKYYNSWVKWNFFMFFVLILHLYSAVQQHGNMHIIGIFWFRFSFSDNIFYQFTYSHYVIFIFFLSICQKMLKYNLNYLSYEVQHIVLHLHTISSR